MTIQWRVLKLCINMTSYVVLNCRFNWLKLHISIINWLLYCPSPVTCETGTVYLTGAPEFTPVTCETGTVYLTGAPEFPPVTCETGTVYLTGAPEFTLSLRIELMTIQWRVLKLCINMTSYVVLNCRFNWLKLHISIINWLLYCPCQVNSNKTQHR
jgi:hypothetical protein